MSIKICSGTFSSNYFYSYAFVFSLFLLCPFLNGIFCDYSGYSVYLPIKECIMLNEGVFVINDILKLTNTSLSTEL